MDFKRHTAAFLAAVAMTAGTAAQNSNTNMENKFLTPVALEEIPEVKGNPFGLVYDNAIKENVPGQVNLHPIRYDLKGLEIRANVYTPAGYDPAVVVEHPNGGVKEQVAGLYAQLLAEAGYVALAFDAAYQ